MKKIICFIFVLFSSLNIYANDSIHSLPLTKVAQSQKEFFKICQKLSINCRGDRSALWKVNVNQKKLFFIINDQAIMTQIAFTKGDYEIINQWQLNQYQFSKIELDDEMEQGDKYIFPALYPIRKNEYAIALIQPWHTSFSGGGRGEELADFIYLKAQGKYKIILKATPFYAYEQIRACFSEQDYQLKKHCHDENFTTLSIHYRDVGQPYYQWRFSYVDTDWPAGTMDKRITRTQPKVVHFIK